MLVNKVNLTSDAEIRDALHLQKLHKYHQCPNTVVVDELGVFHGRKRIDVAVLNGCIHGYEIKSAKDNLLRFDEQLEAYVQCFEKLSIVTASNHIDDILVSLPNWCGLILAEKDDLGIIHFETLIPAKRNPSVNMVAMAHFLWKKEASDLLERLGEKKANLRGTRASLYQSLSERTNTSVLSSWIKNRFMHRENWRVTQP
jgi:hypothetical protein